MALKANIAYKSGKTGLPILVIMHGFSDTTTVFAATIKARFAYNNVFTLFVEMRGRNGSGGSQDCSAREIHDIYDAVEYVKTNYASIIDSNQVHLVGYSGGGGNAFACAAKFPDYFNTLTSFFGMSDYGHDAVDGWYQNGADAGHKTLMETWIGDNPTNVPDAYHARAHVLGIANYSGGHINMLQDDDDAVIPYVNITNVKDILDGAGLSNYTINRTTAANAYRWIHGYPTSGSATASLIVAENIFINPIVAKTYPAWTIPATGTVTVCGYVITKRFSIWLGGLTEAAVGAGLDEIATVSYNTTTDQYTVTPLTGNMDVYIKQGTKTANQSITEETLLTVT